MAIREFLNRRWWLLALGAVLGGLAAYIATQHMTPVYRATTTVLITRNATPPNPPQPLSVDNLTEYAQLVRRPSVLNLVTQRLSLPLTRDALNAKIDVSVIKNTQMLSVTAVDPNADFAAILATGVAQALIDVNNSQQPTAAITVARPAETPSTAAGSSLFLNIDVGIVLGLLLALARSLLSGRLLRDIRLPFGGPASAQDDTSPWPQTAITPAVETPLYVAPPLNRRPRLPHRLLGRQDDASGPQPQPAPEPASEPVAVDAMARLKAALRAASPQPDAASALAPVDALARHKEALRAANPAAASVSWTSLAQQPPTAATAAPAAPEPVTAVPAQQPVAAVAAQPLGAVFTPAQPIAELQAIDATAPVSEQPIDLLTATIRELMARSQDTATMIRALQPNARREEG